MIHQAEEGFPDRIVQTISPSGHTLANVSFQQPFLMQGILILPALIRMEDKPSFVREPGESFIQHLFRLMGIGAVTDGIANDFTIMQVNAGREKQRLSF